jgi:hypothetical protein
MREIEVIMQDNGLMRGSMSTSSSFSIDSKTMKVGPQYPYSSTYIDILHHVGQQSF